jgi:hypothetical protein
MSDFRRIATDLGNLVAERNAAYGNAFAKCSDFLRLLYPDGIRPDEYGDALLLVRIFDKQMRIATDKDAFGESPYRDIAGYGILGVSKDEPLPPANQVPKPEPKVDAETAMPVLTGCDRGSHQWQPDAVNRGWKICKAPKPDGRPCNLMVVDLDLQFSPGSELER